MVYLLLGLSSIAAQKPVLVEEKLGLLSDGCRRDILAQCGPYQFACSLHHLGTKVADMILNLAATVIVHARTSVDEHHSTYLFGLHRMRSGLDWSSRQDFKVLLVAENLLPCS